MNRKIIEFVLILIFNIILAYIIVFYANSLELPNPLKKNQEEDLIIAFFSVILFPAYIHEFCLRYMLKNDTYLFGSLFCCIIYSILPMSLWIFIFAVSLCFLTLYLYQKKNINQLPLFLIVLFALLSTVINLENHIKENIVNLNYTQLFLMGTHYIILAAATSYLRIKNSFYSSVVYHFCHNAAVVIFLQKYA